jgi:hypothetical protein
MAKKKIDVKRVLASIREGLNDTELTEKYGLTSEELKKLFRMLVKRGNITQEDIDKRKPLASRKVTTELFTCPHCKMPQFKPFEVCPQCGVIVGKFEKSEPESESTERIWPDRAPSPEPVSEQLSEPITAQKPDQEPAHTSSSPAGGGAGAPESSHEVSWQFDSGGEIVAAPTVEGGFVYFTTRSGDVHCVDSNRREEKWRFKANGAILASPVIHGQVCFVGTVNGRFFAIDIASGEEKWNFNAMSPIYATAAVDSGRVYFGTDSGTMFWLDSETG